LAIVKSPIFILSIPPPIVVNVPPTIESPATYKFEDDTFVPSNFI